MLQTKVDVNLSLLHERGDAYVVLNLRESDGTMRHVTISVGDWSLMLAKPNAPIIFPAMFAEEVHSSSKVTNV